MNKLIPTLVLTILAFLLILSWNSVLTYNSELRKAYDKHIEKAEKLENKQVYIDAVKEYEAALNLRPNEYGVAMKVVDLYDKLELSGDYAKACRKAIKSDSSKKEPYILLLDYYLEMSAYGKANSLLAEAQKAIGNDSDLTARMIELKSKYAMQTVDRQPAGTLVYPDGSDSGCYKIIVDGLYGIASSGGKLKIPCEYDEIGILNNKLIPVKKNGEYYFLDEDGYRKLVPDEPAEYFGSFGNGYAPAAFNGKYGYINDKLKQFKMEYEFTGSFANKLAAVKKDGKWGIINSSFEKVTDFIFDEILMDEYTYATTYEVFFARTGSSWALYDKKGKKISDDYDEVQLFASKEPAAVKKNGKWGFLSIEGKLLVDPQYEDARSSCVGYAPVLLDGKWGAVDMYGNIILNPEFDSLSAFWDNGYAYAELDGKPKFIIVRVYDE